MASHPHSLGGASALPLSLALSVIPSLPRPLLSRLVARAIERLDELDGDPDLEDCGDAEPTDEREPEDDGTGFHGMDQRMAESSYANRPWHIDRAAPVEP